MKQIEKKVEEFRKCYKHSSLFECFDGCEKELTDWFTKALQDTRKEATKDLLKQMLKECDKTENEAGRLLVKKFMR